MNQVRERFIEGYARLLDAPVENFFRDGIAFISTPIRDRPEWANWVQPIWLFDFEGLSSVQHRPAMRKLPEPLLRM